MGRTMAFLSEHILPKAASLHEDKVTRCKVRLPTNGTSKIVYSVYTGNYFSWMWMYGSLHEWTDFWHKTRQL